MPFSRPASHKPAGQGAAADDHLPAGQVQFFYDRAGNQHVNDRGHTVGEGDVLGDDQLEQHFRFVFARVDLPGAQHGAQIGNSPGVDVKHGRHGHVNIPGIEACLGLVGTQAGHEPVSMQHDLAVAEVDALGQARRTGGIKGGGHGVFVEIGEVIFGCGRGQQVLHIRLPGSPGCPDSPHRR
jgi:hypothetical protein